MKESYFWARKCFFELSWGDFKILLVKKQNVVFHLSFLFLLCLLQC